MASDAKMTALTENVIKQISDQFSTFKSRNRSLELKRIWAEDNLDPNDLASQVQAKDNEQTWGIPIKATVQLVDNITKEPVGKPSTIQVAKLPKMTSRFSFIVDGGEYQVDHLLKLRSGVYTKVRRNGDLASEFMLRKGGHKNFSLELDRKKSLIQFKPTRGSAHIPVYPLMKVMGVSDDEMERTWGSAVFQANRIQSDEGVEKTLRKFYEKTGGESPTPSMNEVREHVYRYFDDTELLPETTKFTLGQPFTKVSGGALLSAAHKLIKLERKEVEPDDRDSLLFKEAVHVEDFIPEKLFKSRNRIFTKVRNTLSHKTSASEILQGGDLFNRPIKEFFTQGGNVSERSEQTNPVQMLSGNFKTTLIAKDFGGMKDADKLGDEMRMVNPSHFGFLDPMHTPESERTGITLHLGSGVRKEGNELKAPVFDLKLGKHRTASVPEFHMSTVVLPDQVNWVGGKPVPIADSVKVKLPGGDIEKRPFKDATFVMPTAKGMLSYASNLIPFLPCDQGNRASMADKQMEQAISLKYREAPLVQSVVHQKDPTHTFEKMIGTAFAAHRAPLSGHVTKVTDDAIHIHDGKVEHKVHIYNNFPLNDPTTMMHSIPIVKVGDEVKAGQLVADTNFTKNGTLALGTNLRIGYLPYKGYNFEDGVVISETAAKKMTSEHLHKLRLDVDPGEDRTSKSTWKAHSSKKAAGMTKEQWHALDEDGVIKPGTRVESGQVLATCLTPNLEKSLEMVKRFGSKSVKPWKDKSLTWDEDYVGVVTRVVKSPNGKTVKVFVKTEEPAEIGDKLSGRHGNKGIITKILPDDEMPFTKHGDEKRPLEVLLNPSGVPTRMNVGQVLETAAAKIAEKTGQTYVVNNFAGSGHNYRNQVLNDLKKHGISDEEMVYDPQDPRKPLGSVLVGPQHVLKLKHQVEKKLVVRGGGSGLNEKPYGYDPDHQPVRGGPHGGQGFGALELYSLLGHNARANLREMSSYKSDQQNEDFWRLIQEGHEPRAPQVTFAYTKFEGLLKGLGVDVQKQGSSIRMIPMSDAEVKKLGGRNELQNPGLVVSKTMKPEKGGLFDPLLTGVNGDRWSYFTLSEPLPNPLFVGDQQNKGPIPALLSLKHGDLSVADIDAIVTGKKTLNGKTGGAAIRDALRDINVEASIKEVREQLLSKRGNKKDQANRTLKYLLALKDHGKSPADAYVLNHVPVLPPIYRPLTATNYGDVAKSPLNDLYRNMMVVNEKLKAMPVEKFGHEPTADLRVNLWNGFKALQAVGDYKPIYDPDAHEERQLSGIVDIIGSGGAEGQPKEGYFQAKLVKRKQDLSIRSTIVPEPSLHIDQVGLPKHAAMELYKPFVIAHMHTKFGYRPDEALSHMQRHTDQAAKALDDVMKDRPLLLKRDPALHKFSVMAFRPIAVDGKAIKIHPLVTGGFNADFDGDTMAGTVPISREAVEEAKKMFPSKNLFSPTTYGAMHVPNQEFMLGLHLISKWGKDSGKSFDTLGEMKRAHSKGELGMTDVASLGGKPTTLGRALIAEGLPHKLESLPKILRDPAFVVTSGSLREMVREVAKGHPDHFDSAVNHLKDLGTDQSFKQGFSLGLKDFAPLPERDRIVAEHQKKADHIMATEKNQAVRDEKLVDLWTGATAQLMSALQARAGETRLSTMVYSGARGKKDQYRQMVAAPMLVQDSSNRTVPTPVLGSYGEGLDVGDYWLSQHGARKGTLQRASGTKEPGAMTKDIINSTISTLITSEDCKTNHGISLSLEHPDIHDRYLASAYGQHKAGTLLTPTVVNDLKKVVGPKKSVQVRSPLRCQHGEGVCAKCFGLNENGKLHPVGTNIGVLAGQALGEPATQLAMDAFHSGGIAAGRGGSSVSKIERLKQLLRMPKTLRGSAVLATQDGPIQAITPNPGLGGHDVVIGGVTHHVREGEKHDDLAVGNLVYKGQSLSKDVHPIHPKELLGITKDVREVQRYLTDELYNKLYQGENVRQRNVELVVRSLTNYTKVKDPGHSHWEVGDVVPHSIVEEHNRELKGANAKPVVHEPILEGSNTIPRLSENWMARLNYQRLGETIQRAAGMGWKSDLHGSHPIPGIAYGKEFGKPTSDVPPKKSKFVY